MDSNNKEMRYFLDARGLEIGWLQGWLIQQLNDSQESRILSKSAPHTQDVSAALEGRSFPCGLDATALPGIAATRHSVKR